MPNHRKKLDFFIFAEKYLEDYPCKDGRMIASAVKKFKLAINSLSIKISDITPKHMETFKNYLIYKSGLRGETPHNYFTRFKKVLKAAKVEGYIKVLPSDDIRFSNPNKDDTLKKEVLDKEELQQLANTKCGNQDVKRAFLFACYTSLGFAEIRDLKWSNINKGRLITYRNKTGELINNRLNATAICILGEPKRKEDYVFNLQNFSANRINKTLKNWVVRASIEKHITFYCARHTFACLLFDPS